MKNKHPYKACFRQGRGVLSVEERVSGDAVSKLRLFQHIPGETHPARP
jgi:hypothetical protein